MHGRFPGKEWSGILLYTVEGSITDLKNFSITAHKFFPLDIGSASYTDFDYDAKVVDMYDMWEDAMEMQSGLIHTHHTMKSFFSQTDQGELHKNVGNYNYYLSLIVNESGVYVAKIASLVTPEVNCIKIKNEEGEIKEVKDLTMDTEPYMAEVTCNVHRPTPAPMQGDPFLNWVNKINEDSLKKNKTYTPSRTTHTLPNNQKGDKSPSHLHHMSNHSVTEKVDDSPSFVEDLPTNTRNGLYAKILTIDAGYSLSLDAAISEINQDCKEDDTISYEAALVDHAEAIFENLGSVAEDFLGAKLALQSEHKLMYDFVAYLSRKKDKKGIVPTIIAYSHIPQE